MSIIARVLVALVAVEHPPKGQTKKVSITARVLVCPSP